MEQQKAELSEKEQLRIRLAIIKEKYRQFYIAEITDRNTPKIIGWFTPPFQKDGMLESI